MRCVRRAEHAVKQQLCIALHDVAPATWPLCERLLTMLTELGDPPVTLLVVPDFHGRGRVDRAPAFLRAIERRLARCDEIALHGYAHRDDAAEPSTPTDWVRRRVLTAGEGEFAALSKAQAAAKLAAGLALFARLDWPLAGFVPPAWLASAGTHAALRETELRYTSDHTGLIALPRGEKFSAPCLTASPRSAWRRQASKWWLALASAKTSSASVVRVGLHPQDAAHDDLMACWKALLQRLLAQREAVTKIQALSGLAAQSAAVA